MHDKSLRNYQSKPNCSSGNTIRHHSPFNKSQYHPNDLDTATIRRKNYITLLQVHKCKCSYFAPLFLKMIHVNL